MCILQVSVQIMKQSFLNAVAASAGFGNTIVLKSPRNPELEFTAASQSSGIVHSNHGHAHGSDGSCGGHHDQPSSHSPHMEVHGHSHGGEECGGHGHGSAPLEVVALPAKETVWGTAQKRVRVLDPKGSFSSSLGGSTDTPPSLRVPSVTVQTSSPLRQAPPLHATGEAEDHIEDLGAPKDS